MVPLMVVFTIIMIIIVDLSIRLILKKLRESKINKQREKALDIGLTLDFASEAKTLKRVQVDEPKAKILAVDDEEIVLSSFRKILVMSGYSVDTVEHGNEALSLVKNNDYDFVFTDLKMPGMDGVAVTKAVHHLRPDVDIVVITGFATVENAIETMKNGAVDYLQKPFTKNEIVEFVDTLLIRRQERLELKTKPKINLVTSSSKISRSTHEFNVLAGIFISKNHLWLSMEKDGLMQVGMDDFSQKILGECDSVGLPKAGQKIKKGDVLFTLFKGEKKSDIVSPVSGRIVTLNENLNDNVALMRIKPYEFGWVCKLEPENLKEAFSDLMVGNVAVDWYQEEIDRYYDFVKGHHEDPEMASVHDKDGNIKKDVRNEDKHLLPDHLWGDFTSKFLSQT